MKHRFGAKFRNRWAIKIKVTGKNQPIGKQKKSSFEIRDGNRPASRCFHIDESLGLYFAGE
jgi:hypothetical protein